jgi:hypothetical protein
MLIKVTLGASLDLEFLKGFTIGEFPFEIQNNDCTAYDFTDSDGTFFAIYAKRNGKLLMTLEFSFASPATNTVYLNAIQLANIGALRAKEYWAVAYDVQDGEKITLFQGITLVS